MSDTIDHSEPSGDDLIAAEYVLGVLSLPERQALARRIERDRTFAALVVAWEARLMPWADDIAPVLPPYAVWNRISAAIQDPNAPAYRPAGAATGSWWNSLAVWRGLAFGTGGLALASIVALVLVIARPAQPPLIAAIEGGGNRQFVATVDLARNSVAVVPAAFATDATRVPELWLIPADGKPRSLGLLRADRAVTIALPPALAALTKDQTVLAVSLEPTGGSPTGAPTGPVIATGKLTTL